MAMNTEPRISMYTDHGYLPERLINVSLVTLTVLASIARTSQRQFSINQVFSRVEQAGHTLNQALRNAVEKYLQFEVNAGRLERKDRTPQNSPRKGYVNQPVQPTSPMPKRYKMTSRGERVYRGLLWEPPTPELEDPADVMQAIQDLFRLRKASKESREYHEALLHALITRRKACPVRQLAEMLDAMDCSVHLAEHLRGMNGAHRAEVTRLRNVCHVPS
ncbi:hypothetical protein K474DRAFT_1680978 [Panus rudis PR-1116 ss-1]|nr:hypothetical protein K474DRAFT_1680978 [Panus rudis PR-1116 ss-1]